MPTFRSPIPLLLMATGTPFAAACGNSGADAASGAQTSADGTTIVSAASCTVNASAQPTCPTPEPSYAGQVKEIINSTCQACHASGGVGAATSGPGGMMRADDASARPSAQDANHRPANFDPDSAHDWSVLANVQRGKTKMMQQVFLCQMPPPDASTLTQSDRSVLLSWLKCGAKDN